MKFEWDDEKNRANVRKHGISFEQAQAIFNGPIWSRLDDRYEYGETRLISIGIYEGMALLAVVHTDRNKITRIISARIATRQESKRYYEEL